MKDRLSLFCLCDQGPLFGGGIFPWISVQQNKRHSCFCFKLVSCMSTATECFHVDSDLFWYMCITDEKQTKERALA